MDIYSSGKVLGGYPMTPEGRPQKVGDDVCDGCGDLDPWSSESAPAFYTVSTVGKKQFIHQMPRELWRYCLEHGCTRCKIIGIALKLFGELDQGDDNDIFKMRIFEPKGSSGIVIGYRKEGRLEIFVPPRKFLLESSKHSTRLLAWLIYF